MSLSRGLGPLGASEEYKRLFGIPDSVDDPSTGSWQGPYPSDSSSVYFQFLRGDSSGWESGLGAGGAANKLPPGVWPDPAKAYEKMDPKFGIRKRLTDFPHEWAEGGMPRNFGAPRYALNRPGDLNLGVRDVLDQGPTGPMGVSEDTFGDFGLTGEAARRAVKLGPKFEPIFWKYPGARSNEPLHFIEGPQGCQGLIDRYLATPAKMEEKYGPIRGYPVIELKGVPRLAPTVRDGKVKDTQAYPVLGYWGQLPHGEKLGWNEYPDPGAKGGRYPSPPDQAHDNRPGMNLKFEPGFYSLGHGSSARIAATYEGPQDHYWASPTQPDHDFGDGSTGGGCRMM